MFEWFKKTKASTLSQAGNGNRGFILEPFSGAWQMGFEVNKDDYPSYYAVFACITLIASDISKMPLSLKKLTQKGVWIESHDKRISKILKKPNTIQIRNQFFSNWVFSLLITGNTYIYIVRDEKGSAKELKVLNPRLVTPLVADDGEVFYSVNADNIAGLEEPLILRADDIIHDRINALFHPLVGLSPIFASGLAAKQGLSIQNNSANFFANESRPGGILIVPGNLTAEQSIELKRNWREGHSGKRVGEIAVLTGNASYQNISMTASDAQMIEQLEMTATIICSTFHVPPYKVGIGDPPPNTTELDSQYYSQCLQPILENIENLIDIALDLPDNFGVEFDLNTLLRMDTKARYESLSSATKGGWMSINEARAKENLPPVKGGDSPYLQQQNYSLEALSKRDQQENPFETTKVDLENNQDESKEEDIEDTAKAISYFLDKELTK